MSAPDDRASCLICHKCSQSTSHNNLVCCPYRLLTSGWGPATLMLVAQHEAGLPDVSWDSLADACCLHVQAVSERLEAALATLAAAEERLSAVELDTAQHAQQRQDSLSRCITLCLCGFCISAHIQCTGTPKTIGCRLPIECQTFTATKAACLCAMSELCNWQR